MELTKRDRFKKGHGFNIVGANQTRRIKPEFDLIALDIMCSYIISENRNIKRTQLMNMRNLFAILDLNYFANDLEKMKRIEFITKGLEGRLYKNLNGEILYRYVNGGIMEEDGIKFYELKQLSTNEVDWINSTVSETLKYAFIHDNVDRMLDVCTRFKASDYRTRGEIVNEIETLVTEMQVQFRRVKSESATEQTFCLKPEIMEERIRDYHEQLSNPANILKTGMIGFNELCGGGLEAQRVYMLLGCTGVGKSMSLLNLAYQFKKYNKDYKSKDITKIPAIVYLTMENSVRETVQRLFGVITNGAEMQNYSPEDILRILRSEGELCFTDDSPIDIIIKFVPDRSVDTTYLYTMVEDLEDEGYEVICLIQDHVKRIRSASPQPDMRMELGAVVNEFKTFATIKDIPVITNSHLNRNAVKLIDEGSKSNQADLTKKLGRGDIGESMLMLDNLDAAFIIQKEYDQEGQCYMAFQRIKIRYRASQRDYICQPFVAGNELKLVDDVGLGMPMFKETLRNMPPSMEGKLPNNGINSAYASNVKAIENKNDTIMQLPINDDDDNIFTSGRYMPTKHTTMSDEVKPGIGRMDSFMTDQLLNPIERITR